MSILFSLRVRVCVGNGEQGKPFPLTDTDRVDQAYRENGFNIYVSDRISLNRSVADIRHPKWVRVSLLFTQLVNATFLRKDKYSLVTIGSWAWSVDRYYRPTLDFHKNICICLYSTDKALILYTPKQIRLLICAHLKKCSMVAWRGCSELLIEHN